MKIFDSGNGWATKVNFVDVNNVLVGYDMGQCCCEHADWFISDERSDTISQSVIPDDLEDFVFDKDFFVENSGREFYEGGMVIFRLTNGSREIFLHLFNVHNGYYSHGFTMDEGELVLRYGNI